VHRRSLSHSAMVTEGTACWNLQGCECITLLVPDQLKHSCGRMYSHMCSGCTWYNFIKAPNLLACSHASSLIRQSDHSRLSCIRVTLWPLLSVSELFGFGPKPLVSGTSDLLKDSHSRDMSLRADDPYGCRRALRHQYSNFNTIQACLAVRAA
jgi:hypothetical protein